jgi:PD-(D/E)XK nuclease superfamily
MKLFSPLEKRGLNVERQKLIPIRFDDLIIDNGFRADNVVEGKLLIELKSIERSRSWRKYFNRLQRTQRDPNHRRLSMRNPNTSPTPAPQKMTAAPATNNAGSEP